MQNKTTTDFNEWLAGLNLEDFSDIHSLFYAVSKRETYGIFTCTIHEDETFVACETETDQVLELRSEVAREAFINVLEYNYGGDLGIESKFAHDEQKEKLG